MSPRREIWLWIGIIALLLVVEFAEVTHVFTIPIQNAFANVVSFVVALIFTTIVAIVGAIFIGISISQRLLSPRGFSPFEEEMLKMRADVQTLREQMERMRSQMNPDPASDDGPPPRPP